MDRLKDALETLDEVIFDLEHKVGLEKSTRAETAKKQTEILKQIRSREAGLMAVTQKVAMRLDEAIVHVEQILRH